MKLKNTTQSVITLHLGKTIKVLNPNEEVLVFDEDVEKSEGVLKVMQSGQLLKTSDEEPFESETGVDADNMPKIITWIISTDIAIRFVKSGTNWDVGNSKFSTTANSIAIGLKITNGTGIVDTFNSVATVTVATTGSATITQTMPVAFVNGLASITLNNTVNEDVTLSLSGGNTSLDKTDTVLVTFA